MHSCLSSWSHQLPGGRVNSQSKLYCEPLTTRVEDPVSTGRWGIICSGFIFYRSCSAFFIMSFLCISYFIGICLISLHLIFTDYNMRHIVSYSIVFLPHYNLAQHKSVTFFLKNLTVLHCGINIVQSHIVLLYVKYEYSYN